MGQLLTVDDVRRRLIITEQVTFLYCFRDIGFDPKFCVAFPSRTASAFLLWAESVGKTACIGFYQQAFVNEVRERNGKFDYIGITSQTDSWESMTMVVAPLNDDAAILMKLRFEFEELNSENTYIVKGKPF